MPEQVRISAQLIGSADLDSVAEPLNQIAEVEKRYYHIYEVVGGYWASTSLGYQFKRFPTGQYTVVAFDTWGDRAIGHFQVVP